MRHLWTAILLAGALCLPATLRAEMAECRANLNGVEVTIPYDREAEVWSSFREKRLTRAKTCPGKVVIAHMVPGLTEAELSPFCAVYDETTNQYRTVAEGERDAYGRCAQPSRACRIVNATKREVLEIGTLGFDVATAGVNAATNRAGALILTGNASAVAGALSEVSTAVTAAVSAPGVLAGAAVSVVVVGGAVYVCK